MLRVTMLLLGCISALAQNNPLPMSVKPHKLRQPVKGVFYRQNIELMGGTPPYKISELPPGLSSGRIQGGFELYGRCTGTVPAGVITISDSSDTKLAIPFGCAESRSVLEPDYEYKLYYGLQQSQASSSDRTWKRLARMCWSRVASAMREDKPGAERTRA